MRLLASAALLSFAVTVNSTPAMPGPKPPVSAESNGHGEKRQKIKVANIQLALQSEKGQYRVAAVVLIVDGKGDPIADVTVAGDWTLNKRFLNASKTAADGTGKATLFSEWTDAQPGDSFDLILTDVSKDGYEYEPTLPQPDVEPQPAKYEPQPARPGPQRTEETGPSIEDSPPPPLKRPIRASPRDREVRLR